MKNVLGFEKPHIFKVSAKHKEPGGISSTVFLMS